MQKPGPDGIAKTRWAVIRNTYPQLKDTTIKTFHDWFPPRIFGEYKIASHDFKITAFDGFEIEILFRALDKPEHVANLLSMELTGAWINEAREVPKAIIDALDTRIGRFPAMKDGGCTWKGIFMDTNPPDDDSWWYKMFELELPDNAEIFKQPSALSDKAENLPNLDPDYYSDIMKGKSKDFINVYIKAQYGYVKEGTPVYEATWNDTIHVAAEPLRPIMGRDLIIGFDFGLTPSAVICQITPRGFFHVLDELTSDGIGIDGFIRNSLKPLLATKYLGFTVKAIGDPAGTTRSQTDEKSCMDILRAHKLPTKPATSDRYVDRIGAVEHFLTRLTDGRPTFQLNPSCRILRKGFNSGYAYRKIRTPGTIATERKSDEPIKNIYSHPHDALQYACLHVAEYTRRGDEMKQKVRRSSKTYVTASKAGY